MSSIRFYCVLCGTALEASSASQHDLMECSSCARYVPIPRPVDLRGRLVACQPVLSPLVLELTVTFECTECRSRLRADARWEGRKIGCPDCGGKTGVPRWSNVPVWPRSSSTGEKTRPQPPRAPVDLDAAVLTREEIAFLSGAVARDSETAA